MAHDSMKKLEQRNKETIKTIRITLITYWILYAVIRSIFINKMSIMQGILSTIVFFTTCGIYNFFVKISKPRYDENNKLVDAGSDLLAKSWISYLFDILYSTHFCLFISLFHRKLVWSFMILPLTGLYLLWAKVISPWIFKSTIEPGAVPQVDYQRQMQQQMQMQRSQRRK